MSQGFHATSRFEPLDFHEGHDARRVIGCANCGAAIDEDTDEQDDAGRMVCSARCQTQSNSALRQP